MICPLMFLGPFWGFNSSFLGGRGAAGAIAAVELFAGEAHGAAAQRLGVEAEVGRRGHRRCR